MINLRARKLTLVLLTCVLTSCGGSGTISELTPDAGIELGAAEGLSGNSYSVQLSGTQVLPVVDTQHTAYADFTHDPQTGRLFGTVTTTIENTTSVHLHEGGVGEVGAEVVALIVSGNDTGNTVFNMPAGFVLSAQQTELYNASGLYVDLHAGDIELRGQLSLEQPVPTINSTLDDIQAKLFTPVCSGCHAGTGNSLPAIMDLTDADASYASLVGVYSINEPDLLRVDIGNASSSLLVKKIEGTQTIGARMPFRGAMLDANTIAAVKRWISTGAAR